MTSSTELQTKLLELATGIEDGAYWKIEKLNIATRH